MNNVSLIGRLTKDPELRNTADGTAVCSFSLAVRRGFKNANGEYDADFINCSAWRNTAEFVSKYFKKGQQVGICGQIRTRKWDDNGTTRYSTDVVAEKVDFVGKNSGTNEANSSSNNDIGGLPLPPAVDDDDLPF